MEQIDKFKILIVEDDDDTAQIQAAELKDHGLLVDIVSRGDAAIAKMKEWFPHLVVLDLDLPGKNGVEILHEMKHDPQLRDILVVGNSIHMDPKDELGRRFYDSFVFLKKEEPLFVNKLSTDESLQNNLTAMIGFCLSERYKVLPRLLAEYLDGLNKSKKQQKEESQNQRKWEIL